jgi:hypothetical protein
LASVCERQKIFIIAIGLAYGTDGCPALDGIHFWHLSKSQNFIAMFTTARRRIQFGTAGKSGQGICRKVSLQQ